jgi:hypothetical protein
MRERKREIERGEEGGSALMVGEGDGEDEARRPLLHHYNASGCDATGVAMMCEKCVNVYDGYTAHACKCATCCLDSTERRGDRRGRMGGCSADSQKTCVHEHRCRV